MSDATLSTCRALAEVETQARRHLPSRVDVRFRHLIAWVLPGRLQAKRVCRKARRERRRCFCSVVVNGAGCGTVDGGFSRAYLGRGRRHAAWLREGSCSLAGRRPQSCRRCSLVVGLSDHQTNSVVKQANGIVDALFSGNNK